MSRVAYIDGDILCYKAGFAAQKSYIVVRKNGSDVGSWKNATEAKVALSVQNLEDFTVDTVVVPEPVNHCLKTVKSMIKNWTRGALCSSYKCFLDGEGNFRKEVATILPYKGNRSSPKPAHYEAIREYLVKHHNASLVRHIESDDMLSIAQYQDFLRCGDVLPKAKRIIVTIDKDAKNTPGWLYNPDKDLEPKFITETQAARNFFTQLVTGDKVDNIQGIPGMGDRSGLVKDLVVIDDPSIMYEAVLQAYTQAGLGLPALQENAKLLWMLRKMPASKEELYVPWTFEDHFYEKV